MTDSPLLEAGTLWDLIELRANTSPDDLFGLDDREQALSFSDYRNACLRAAAGLQALGVREGSAVSWIGSPPTAGRRR